MRVRRLIWESDCISFAQGILEEIIKDIRNLNQTLELETPSEREGSSEGPTNMGKSVLKSQASLMSETLNSSVYLGQSAATTRASVAQGPQHAKASPEKKTVSITSLKITGGNENGETMKSYRETIERYIKEHLVHCPKDATGSTSEGLKLRIKEFFQEVALR